MSEAPAPRRTSRFGWIPDPPDIRDLYLLEPDVPVIPTQVDLRRRDLPVYDQSDLGSCTANGVAYLCEYAQLRDNLGYTGTPSRLFIYYEERVIIGTVAEDSGAYIRDGMRVVNRLGAPPEHTWPYVIERFTTRPPEPAYVDALNHQVLVYRRVAQRHHSLKSALARGYPVVFGFTVYESFMTSKTTKTGIVPFPKKTEKVLGGHCVVIDGYDDTIRLPYERARGAYIVRNSWGNGAGDNGYYYFPYRFITNADLCSDFWIVRKEEG